MSNYHKSSAPTNGISSLGYTRHRYAPLLFLLGTLVAQCGGLALSILARTKVEAPLGIGAIWALAALLIAYTLRLPRSWCWINALLGWTLFSSLTASLPSYIFLAPLIITVLLFLPTFWTRVPYYPTSPGMLTAIVEELPKDTQFTFCEIGCGVGHVIAYVSKVAPLSTCIGVELSILPYIISKVRCLHRKNVQIRYQNFWNLSFREYNYIYAFLAPGPMAALYEKFTQEKKKGATLLVNSFPCPSIPQKIIEIHDDRACTLYIYR